MPRRLRWILPAIRFATDSRQSYKISSSDSDLEEKRLEQPDLYGALWSTGLLDSSNKRLNETKLLELSDDIRAHLVEDASLGPRAGVVKRALRELVRDESSIMPTMDFAIIQNARLDKLLSDILTLGHQQTSSYPRPRIDIVMAERLQRLWMARFREKYFNIDQIRHQNLSSTGTMAGEEVYIIRRYSHKQNLQTRLHRTVITLERIPGQPNIADLAKVPRPSQVDDWLLFEKFEGEMIRQHHGEQSFLDWKLMKAQERMERRQWRRALEVGAALTTARHARYSYGMRDMGFKEDAQDIPNQ
ncbi:hypothetical protein THAR02_00211 [Trichoderma harzianum]|uniref:Uncharacterized protein n=1 Tax=Trichoderma harzianum TaxID=5544 RepID=A0A0F9XT49_TRIHA|nr:hypothetical protein THAR02_00211 [Trichoderma harzianum]